MWEIVYFIFITGSPIRSSQFVCAPLLNNSGGPSPPSLVGSCIHLSCAPRHHSATDSSRRRGTAALLLGATCHLAANPASLLWCLSLSLRARYRYRSVFHHHLVLASAHSAAGVLPVLLLPDQGEVQVHVLCHLQHQGKAGILKTTLC